MNKVNKVNKVKNTLAQQVTLNQQEQDAKVASELAGTIAGQLWEEIKEKSIEIFALPDQQVQMHCHPVNIEPNKLYLVTKSLAVLPSLEVALGKNYVVELLDKYITVSRTPAPLGGY